MREYFTLHRSVFPSYLTIESGRILYILRGVKVMTAFTGQKSHYPPANYHAIHL